MFGDVRAPHSLTRQPAVWGSTGGLVWARATLPPVQGDASITALSVDGTSKLAMGTLDGSLHAWSYDGSRWSDAGGFPADDRPGARLAEVGDVTLTSRDAYAAADDGTRWTLWRSTDLRRWQPVQVPSRPAGATDRLLLAHAVGNARVTRSDAWCTAPTLCTIGGPHVSSSASRPIVEIRVHGVNGGSPEDMLGDPFPVPVAGDDSARFLRPKGWQATDPHIREAFHWGRFTSGSPLRALWLLLAPFAILNLAGFTLLPSARRPDPGRVVRLIIRLLGLALTGTLLLAVARTTMDLLMHQCAGAPLCVSENGWLGVVAWKHEGPRFLVGVVPPGLVIALLWWFGRQTFLYDPPGRPADLDFTDNLGDRGFWHTGARATPLRAAHVIAACAMLGGLCLAYLGAAREGSAIDPTAWSGWGLIGFGLLLAVAVVVVAVPGRFVKPGIRTTVTSGRVEQRQPTRREVSRARLAKVLTLAQRVALGALLAVVAFAAGTTWDASLPATVGEQAPGRAPLPGFEDAAVVMQCVLGGLLVLLSVACLVLVLTHQRPATLPRSFRPLWCGFAPLVLAALAVTLAGGLSGGLVFWVGNLLGRIAPESAPLAPAKLADPLFEWTIMLGPSYFTTGLVSSILVLALAALLPGLAASLLRTGPVTEWLLLAAGVVAGAAVVLAGRGITWWLTGAAAALTGAGAWAWRRAWGREHLPELVILDYPLPGRPDPDTIAPTTESDTIAKIATQWRLARTKYRFHWLLGTVAGLGGAGLVAAALLSVLRLDPGPIAVSAAGPLLLSGVAAGFVALGVRSWGNQKLRVTVGILWDLLAFWPRSNHPLCPPPYGGRAVLELARRAKDIATTDPHPRVVLSGHSQGSLVCLAAVAVLAVEEVRDGQHSGTEFIRASAAGATLRSLSLVTYGSQLHWAYARLFPRYVGFGVLTATFDPILDARWRNLYRWTDPLGGPVLSWPADGRPTPSGLADAKQVWESVTGPATIARDGRVGPDIRLRDPVRIATMPHTVRAPLLGHSNYFADVDGYRHAVGEVTADLVQHPAD